MPSVIWTVLWYIGVLIGAYFLAAVVFVLTARLEKDADGSLIIDPKSLHYRVCEMCYEWRAHEFYSWETNRYISKAHVEYYQLSCCGYFWRVFWAFILLLIAYPTFYSFQIIQIVIYSPFMFLFGYYMWWPMVKSKKRYDKYDKIDPFAVETCRISFPRIGKLELKPYLVVLPALYSYVYWLYPDRTLYWSIVTLGVVMIVVVVVAIVTAFEKNQGFENQRVILAREYVKSAWRGVCPRLKVKSGS